MQHVKPHAGMSSCHGRWRSFALALTFIALGCAFVCRTGAQTLQDYFTNRITVTNLSGQILQNNSNATVEVNEPKHGGKTGGHSLWISWVAPTNGIVEFKTETSRFDTLLSAYQFATTNGATFADLREVARADDSEGFERESEIEFGVVAGERYEVAVDGYFGAVGQIELQWKLRPLASPPPQILNTLADRSVNLGDAVSLAFIVTNAVNGQYKWYFNGDELITTTTTNLLIPNLQITNVGRYKMRVRVDGEGYYTVPVEIQINTEGAVNTLARGKILDAPATPLNSDAATSNLAPAARPGISIAGGDVGVVRGYIGSQIFNTIYATVDTNEPPHCGITAGASYWLLYQPPTNGTITLDTIGSTYDTAMEVYTFNGALTGYHDLISLVCDNDAVAPNGAARVQTPVVKTRQYLIVVTGVNGARGTAWLNYSINTNQQPTAPILLSQPGTTTVAQGSPATLTASLAGSPPLHFSWKKNNAPMPGVTSPAIFFPSALTNDTADYVMIVTNDLGSLSATMPLHVVIPTQCLLAKGTNWLQLNFPTVSGQRYTVEQAGLLTGPWQPWPHFYIGDGQPLMLNLPGEGSTFYRVRVE